MRKTFSDHNKALIAKHAITLARVSSKEQEEGYSIDAQKHRLETYCFRKNLDIIKTFDIVESSTNGDRVQFMDMIKFVKSQKMPIAIVADKVDRVQRSFKEYPMLDELIQLGKIELHFNTENYIIHKESVSQERLMWSMGVIMAQSYVDNLRDNVKRSIEQKIRQGEWIAMAPVGYLNIRENQRGSIAIDPDRGLLVRRIFEEYATGLYTLKEMVQRAKQSGLKNRVGKHDYLNVSQMHSLLRNPFYCGTMLVKGQYHEHKYPHIISRELFNECQDVTSGRNKRDKFHISENDFVFRGILTCAITGTMVTADKKKKTYVSGKQAEWTYLRSFDPANPEKRIWIREEKILEQAVNALKNLELPEDLRKLVIDTIRQTDQVERQFLERQIKELQGTHAGLQKRLDNLMDFLLDGVIDKVDFEIKKRKIRDEQLEIEIQLSNHRECDDVFKNALIDVLNVTSNAHQYFLGSTNEQKRQLLNFVFANLSLKGSSLCFEYTYPFNQPKLYGSIEKWRPLLYELRTNPLQRSAIIALSNHPICKHWA